MRMPSQAGCPRTSPANEWPVEDRRADPRYETPSFVRALDRSTLAVVGEIDDISLGGFRLQLSSPEVLGDRQYRSLRLDMCVDGQPREPIDLVARVCWTHHDPALGVTLAGFELGHLSAKAATQLKVFIGELSA